MKALGKYQLIAEIKRNEHGVTYRGWDEERQSVVLLKTFKPQSATEDCAPRFKQEAEAYARLAHANVVRLWEYGFARGECFLALEFVEGQNLRRVLSRALPPEIATAILCEALRGLAEIHRQNIVHRDLKPENILLSHEGKVKLCDFDLALSEARAPIGFGITGSPGYVAPEIILGEKITAAADIFSLGVVFYEMLAHARPFQAASSSAEMNAIVRLAPVPLAQVGVNVPAQLEAFLLRMLAKRVSERRANLEDLARYFELGDSATREQLIRNYLAAPEKYQTAGLTPRVRVSPQRGSSAKRRFYISGMALVAILFTVIRLALNTNETPAEKTNLPPQPAIDSLLQYPKVARTEPEKPPSDLAKAAVSSKHDAPDSTRAPHLTAPSARQILLRSTPWAFLFVNGDSLGMTPHAVTLRTEAAPYQLVLRNPQFPRVELTLPEVTQLADTITISLWERVAQLELQITPWAEVYINGEKSALAEGEKRLLLLPGRYSLRFVHSQLGEKTETIALRAGETRTLAVNMF